MFSSTSYSPQPASLRLMGCEVQRLKLENTTWKKSPPHSASAGGYARVWDASRGLVWHRLLVGRSDTTMDHQRFSDGSLNIGYHGWSRSCTEHLEDHWAPFWLLPPLSLTLISLTTFPFGPLIHLHFTVYPRTCGCSQHALLFTSPTPDS